MRSSSDGHTRRMQLATTAQGVASSLEGVLVEGVIEGRKVACSGLMFAGGQLVLTHGVLLSALHVTATPPSKGELLEPSPQTNLRLKVLRERPLVSSDAQVAAWWSCPLLSKSARALHAQGWRFSPDDEDSEALAVMLVLSLGRHAVPLSTVREALAQLLQSNVLPAGKPSPGSAVLLESTPFGSASLFLNSWSRGVVSAVTGEGDSLLLCDVHAAPGCEGAALYVTRDDARKHLLLGLAVLPFSVVRGEAVALCLCANMAPVLTRLLGASCPPGRPAIKLDAAVTAASGAAGVALVRHGGSWASAVAIQTHPAIFLTCSHALQGAGETTLQWPGGGEPRKAEIVFRTPNGAAYDLAVVRTSGTGPRALVPTPSPPLKGEEVLVVGYGVLSPPTLSLGTPLVSRGCVTRSGATMVQTSCAVQSGASGGAVLRADTGHLLALVVGHMRALNSAPLPRDWPRLNFAIPVSAIAPAICGFLRTGDAFNLRQLESCDPNVQRLWKLDPQPVSKL